MTEQAELQAQIAVLRKGIADVALFAEGQASWAIWQCLQALLRDDAREELGAMQ